MELERWLEKHDIKSMVLREYENYLSCYKVDDLEDYNELFKGKENVKTKLKSVAYIINHIWVDDNDEYTRYINAVLEIESNGVKFARYSVIFSLDGEIEDDYLLSED